jgi:hypothetical protein
MVLYGTLKNVVIGKENEYEKLIGVSFKKESNTVKLF